MAQPKGFEDLTHLNYVYKIKKAIYRLKQDSRAWYERLSDYIVKKGYSRGVVDRTLFIKRRNHVIIMVQVYADDIVFGAMSHKLVEHFVEHMSTEFETSLEGKLTCFLGLQVKQTVHFSIQIC